MPAFLGFDHLDVRVSSLAAVEEFYHAFMPLIGLPECRYVRVDGDEWTPVEKQTGTYNAFEFFEEPRPGEAVRFMGLIEDPGMQPVMTRIAFRLDPHSDLQRWAETLHSIGARTVEISEDIDVYPAIFFEDPAGTKLELCARRPRV